MTMKNIYYSVRWKQSLIPNHIVSNPRETMCIKYEYESYSTNKYLKIPFDDIELAHKEFEPINYFFVLINPDNAMLVYLKLLGVIVRLADLDNEDHDIFTAMHEKDYYIPRIVSAE